MLGQVGFPCELRERRASGGQGRGLRGQQFRDLATRRAKRAAYYQVELTAAAIILWLR